MPKKNERNTHIHIHIVFDRIISPSIKDIERERRNCSKKQSHYSVFTKHQRRAVNFTKSLRSNSFKKRLNEFLIEEWRENEYYYVIGERKLFIICNEKCFHFKTENGKVFREHVNELESFQEEADTRMMLHLSFLPKHASVIIRSSDTDVLIIALYNLSHLTNSITIWLEVGTMSKNNLRHIDVNKIHHELGPTLCASLPGFYSFTGCDYKPSFFKKGKIKPFKILKSRTDFQYTFSQFGNVMCNTTNLDSIENFVCSMYQTRALNVNEARYEIFYKTCRPTSNKFFKNIKSFEGSLLPPSKSVLLQQINRCNYICRVWKNAVKNEQIQLSPSEYGWELHDSQYKVNWFNGNVAPDRLKDILINDVDASDDEVNYISDSSDESDKE